MKGSDSNGQYSKIDKNTTLKGNVNADSDIRIDGRVEGELITTGKIILGKHAQVKGKIRCSNADIEGVFEGDLTLSGTLSLKMGSNLQGKVRIQKLIVESGAIFNASCSMHSVEDGVKKLKNVDEKEKQADESVANIL